MSWESTFMTDILVHLDLGPTFTLLRQDISHLDKDQPQRRRRKKPAYETTVNQIFTEGRLLEF